MLKLATLTTLALSILAPPTASADAHEAYVLEGLATELSAWSGGGPDSWEVNDIGDGRAAIPCERRLDRLRQLNVPATAKFTIKWETPDFKPGEYPLSAAPKACERMKRAARVKDFERWAKWAAQTPDTTQIKMYENCQEAYKGLIDDGFPETTRVAAKTIKVEGKDVAWSGTIREIREKYCDAHLKAMEAELAAREAPFRKKLRGAKLTMALSYDATRQFALPGEDWSMNLDKLAASKVWFDRMTGANNETCPNGRVRYELRRYQFDANHNLVKETSRNFCGEPPKSAYK